MNLARPKKINGKEINKCFTNCFIPDTITDGRLMALNDKHLALTIDNKSNKGIINLLNPNNPCNLNETYTLFTIENSNILDMEFSPFNSDVLAFSNENKHIHICNIKDNGEVDSDYYKHHTNKIHFINFNPAASNVICSSSFGEVQIWDVVKFQPHISYALSSNLNSMLWSPNGSLIGFNTGNKTINICDPRSDSMVFESQITEMNTKTKFVWLDDNSIGAIGYKKLEKQFYLNLYDIRNNNQNPYSSFEISTYPSTVTPYVDPELKLIYIIGKDDYYIKIYDYNSGKLQKYSDFMTSELNNLSIQLNRRYLNKNNYELDRFARYTKKNKIFYISFVYKDINQEINELYYPNDEINHPSLTFEEWYQGTKTIPQKVYNKKYTESKTNNVNRNQNIFLGSRKSSNNNYQNTSMEKKNKDIKKNYNQNNLPQSNNINIKKPSDRNAFNIHRKSSMDKEQPKDGTEYYKKKIEELKSQIITMENEKNKIIDEKNDELNKYKSYVSTLSEKLKTENQKYIKKINEYNSQIEIYKRQLKQNNEKEIRYKNFVNKSNNFDNNRFPQNARVNKENEMEKNIKNLKDELTVKINNEKNLKEEINKKIELVKSKESIINKLQQDLIEKENLITKNEEDLKSKDNIINQQKSEIYSLSTLNRSNMSKQYELNDLQKELEKEKNNIKVKEKELNDKNSELEKINKLNETLNKNKQDLEKKYKDEQKKNAILKGENENYKIKLNSIENKQKISNEKITKQYQDELNKVNKEKDNIQKEINEILDSSQKIEKENTSLKQDKQNLNKQIKNLNDEKDLKEQRIKTLQNEISQLKIHKENNATLEKKQKDNEINISKLKLKCDEINKKYEEEKTKNLELENNKKLNEQNDKKNEDKIKELSEEIERYKEDKINISNDYNKKNLELKNELEKLKAEIDDNQKK